ncbi:hypothetical protein [Streptomyces cavourensis]|uniref:hypothetical protein n=1 Tax=Streptomyces cavourensis TaxID=67258 RepID=UPI0030B894E2
MAQQGAAGPVPVYWSQVLVDVSYEYTTGILDDPVLRAAVRLSIEPGPHLTQESYSGVQLLALALEERDQLYGQVAGMWRLQMPGLARPTVLGRLRLERPPQT